MLNKVWANTYVHARADTKNVQTSLKTKGSCNRAWILMKNSNNIKWGVSTADTLLLRALQTDRVTRYTHYAATVQPLSVMMMAALTGAAFKTPLLQTLASNGRVNLRFVARGERKKEKKNRRSEEPLCPGLSSFPHSTCPRSSPVPSSSPLSASLPFPVTTSS